MKKILLSIIFVSTITLAQYSNLGTAGAQFLQIPVAASAEGLGGAVIASVDDASSAFWNPAGLASVQNYDIHFSYLNWFELFDLNALALAYNLGDAGVLGVSLISFTTEKMEITTEESPNGTGRFFDSEDLMMGLTYSRYFTDRFKAGISVKYIYQRIWNETADGVVFDVGTQYRLDFNALTIAMSMSNFGPELQFDGPDLDVIHQKDENYPVSRLTPAGLRTEPYSLPLHFQVGVAMDLYSDDYFKVRAGLDATHPNDNVERVNFGTEFGFFDRLYLRGGYKFNYDDQKFAFGAGANFPFGESTVRFDYSYSIYDILPNVQRVSLGIRF
ncbi:MAG: PorV/PorQ family protein [Ignavibacteriaceae bacterium]|nr:PorV/PorQ family protein [Ignavibacteriaceae bacterium]